MSKSFLYSEFNIDELEHIKKSKGLTVSLVMPCLNEEYTIGNIAEYTYDNFMHNRNLIDEFIILDGNSSDNTVEICKKYDFLKVYNQFEILDTYEKYSLKGKGTALYKSLYVSNSDIIIWVDADIKNYDYKFIVGLLGPLIKYDCPFSKGHYTRPYLTEDNQLSKDKCMSGGRVTELFARPMFNLLYPELNTIIQPLGGEYGGYRKYLEQLNFSSGYGVETEFLINVCSLFGIETLAQVDLGERVHRHQPLNNLTKMSFVIGQTFLNKIEKKHNIDLIKNYNLKHLPNNLNNSNFNKVREGDNIKNGHFLEQELKEVFFPSILNIKEYTDKFYPNTEKISLNLIRHGETSHNCHGIIQGCYESHLNFQGFKQTNYLKDNLTYEPKDTLIFSSDLIRCQQTSDILFDSFKNNNVIYTPLLRERDMGIYTNKNNHDINIDLLREENIREGESLKDLKKRIEEFLDFLLNTLKNDFKKNIILVSHSTFILYFFQIIMGKLPSEIPKNCSVNKFNLLYNKTNSSFDKVYLEKWCDSDLKINLLT